jgi:glyoxylase-like metal-dependent hydrolase (beta-lactamase superfamily II)
MTALRAAAEALPLAVSGPPRRLEPLVVGFEVIAEAISVSGGSGFRHLLEPVTAAAVVFDEGWVLVDGGFDPRRVRDRALRSRSFDYENYTAVVPAGDPLVDQIAELGLDWSHLAGAVLSHAHFDHTGAARLLSPAQPLIMQRAEWTHVTTVEDERAAFLFREDLERDGLTVVLLDGDTELARGLRVLDTAGHTPGHQSVVVELPGSTVVLAGDAAVLRVYVARGSGCGSTVGASGPAAAEAAIRRLQEMDAAPGVQVWPGHDPEWGPWRGVIDRQSGPQRPTD